MKDGDDVYQQCNNYKPYGLNIAENNLQISQDQYHTPDFRGVYVEEKLRNGYYAKIEEALQCSGMIEKGKEL